MQKFHSPHAIITGSNIIPDSLPALRTLRINLPLADDVITCLLGAAGAQLGALRIEDGPVAITTARLVADNDYPWLPALKTLSLPKVVEPQGTFAQRIMTALSRLPALRTLEIALSSSDEMLVRLLALADTGGLPNLAQLRNDSPFDQLSDGAILLLLMWLKREVKKARQGQPSAALWDLTDLRGIRVYQPAGFAKLAAQIHRALEAIK